MVLGKDRATEARSVVRDNRPDVAEGTPHVFQSFRHVSRGHAPGGEWEDVARTIARGNEDVLQVLMSDVK